MDFNYIVNRSFRIAWRYRSLWFFGMFLDGGRFNIDLDSITKQQADFSQWPIGISPELIMPILTVGLVLAMIVIIAGIIAATATIDGVNHIERGGSYTFWRAYSRSLDFFWRMLGLRFLYFMVAMSMVVVLVIMVVVTLFIGIVVVIPLGIAVFYVLFSVFELAARAMVVRDCSISEALEEGYQLFMSRKVDCLKMFAINIGIAVAMAIGIFTLSWLVLGPLNLAVAKIMEDPVGILLTGLVLGLPFSLVVGGFAGATLNTMYTLFYFQLVEPAGVTASGNTSAQGPASPLST